MKLSILIPYTSDRMQMTQDLIKSLEAQCDRSEVDICLNASQFDSIGTKRNDLLQKARGEYVAFIDSDDAVSNTYISDLMEGINKGVDCCSLRGVITWDGANPELFEHSISYKAYLTKPDSPCDFSQHSVLHSNWALNNNIKFDHTLGSSKPIKYERYPNHLNCIKASIAKQFKFPEINHGEDTDWATQIFNSGLIKTEHYIDKVLYHYQYKPNK